GDASGARRCDPDETLRIDSHPIGRARWKVERAAITGGAVVGDRVYEDHVVASVRVVNGLTAGRQEDAVGVEHVVIETGGVSFGVDPPQLAGYRRGVRIEHGEADRTGVDTTSSVRADVVPSRQPVDGVQGAVLAFAHVH